MHVYRWPLIASILLAAVFAILTGLYLAITASGAGEGNPCSPTSGSTLTQEAPRDQRYDGWRIIRGSISGLPPHRTCKLYGLKSVGNNSPHYKFVLERSYPSTDWYETGLLIIAMPFILVAVAQGVIRITTVQRRTAG